jgi:hypothetical protein
MESQWYSISQCYDLIEDPEKYNFIIRIRTDCYINKPLILNNLDTDILYIQNGFCAGNDRKYCDWFALGSNSVMKTFMKETLYYYKKNYRSGIIHMHNFIENITLDFSFTTKNYEFNVPINHMFYKYRK